MEKPIEVDADLPRGFEGLLQIALGKEMRTPGRVLDLVPSSTITVASLLKTTVPAILYPSVVSLPSAEACLTDHVPCWTVEELLKAPIPPRIWLSDLEITVKKKWFTRPGVASIRHPTISSLYLPLWAGNFWYSLIGVVEQKEEWRKAECWVSSQLRDTKVYEARELMRRIPWGMRIWVLTGVDSSSVVGVLAELLSTKWLRERHLDTLASYLNFRGSRDGKGARECWVGDVYFSICLKQVYRATKTSVSNHWDLTKYQDTISTHGYKRLFFPANIDGSHWIVFSVDLIKNEFCYGALFCFA